MFKWVSWDVVQNNDVYPQISQVELATGQVIDLDGLTSEIGRLFLEKGFQQPPIFYLYGSSLSKSEQVSDVDLRIVVDPARLSLAKPPLTIEAFERWIGQVLPELITRMVEQIRLPVLQPQGRFLMKTETNHWMMYLYDYLDLQVVFKLDGASAYDWVHKSGAQQVGVLGSQPRRYLCDNQQLARLCDENHWWLSSGKLQHRGLFRFLRQVYQQGHFLEANLEVELFELWLSRTQNTAIKKPWQQEWCEFFLHMNPAGRPVCLSWFESQCKSSKKLDELPQTKRDVEILLYLANRHWNTLAELKKDLFNCGFMQKLTGLLESLEAKKAPKISFDQERSNTRRLSNLLSCANGIVQFLEKTKLEKENPHFQRAYAQIARSLVAALDRVSVVYAIESPSSADEGGVSGYAEIVSNMSRLLSVLNQPVFLKNQQKRVFSGLQKKFELFQSPLSNEPGVLGESLQSKNKVQVQKRVNWDRAIGHDRTRLVRSAFARLKQEADKARENKIFDEAMVAPTKAETSCVAKPAALPVGVEIRLMQPRLPQDNAPVQEWQEATTIWEQLTVVVRRHQKQQVPIEKLLESSEWLQSFGKSYAEIIDKVNQKFEDCRAAFKQKKEQRLAQDQGYLKGLCETLGQLALDIGPGLESWLDRLNKINAEAQAVKERLLSQKFRGDFGFDDRVQAAGMMFLERALIDATKQKNPQHVLAKWTAKCRLAAVRTLLEIATEGLNRLLGFPKTMKDPHFERGLKVLTGGCGVPVLELLVRVSQPKPWSQADQVQFVDSVHHLPTDNETRSAILFCLYAACVRLGPVPKLLFAVVVADIQETCSALSQFQTPDDQFLNRLSLLEPAATRLPFELYHWTTQAQAADSLRAKSPQAPTLLKVCGLIRKRAGFVEARTDEMKAWLSRANGLVIRIEVTLKHQEHPFEIFQMPFIQELVVPMVQESEAIFKEAGDFGADFVHNMRVYHGFFEILIKRRVAMPNRPDLGLCSMAFRQVLDLLHQEESPEWAGIYAWSVVELVRIVQSMIQSGYFSLRPNGGLSVSSPMFQLLLEQIAKSGWKKGSVLDAADIEIFPDDPTIRERLFLTGTSVLMGCKKTEDVLKPLELLGLLYGQALGGSVQFMGALPRERFGSNRDIWSKRLSVCETYLVYMAAVLEGSSRTAEALFIKNCLLKKGSDVQVPAFAGIMIFDQGTPYANLWGFLWAVHQSLQATITPSPQIELGLINTLLMNLRVSYQFNPVVVAMVQALIPSAVVI